MNNATAGYRIARAALLLGLLTAVAGCSWFRSSTAYEDSPEARPLEVPPDLDTPPADSSMQIPEPAGQPARAAAATPSAAFTVADNVDSTWRRLGLALERVDGVEISERAQALSAYNVKYAGEEFLVRVTAAGEASRIEAVGANGQVRNDGAAGRLLGALKSRLG